MNLLTHTLTIGLVRVANEATRIDEDASLNFTHNHSIEFPEHNTNLNVEIFDDFVARVRSSLLSGGFLVKHQSLS